MDNLKFILTVAAFILAAFMFINLATQVESEELPAHFGLVTNTKPAEKLAKMKDRERKIREEARKRNKKTEKYAQLLEAHLKKSGGQYNLADLKQSVVLTCAKRGWDPEQPLQVIADYETKKLESLALSK